MTLAQMVRNECANYSHRTNGCIFDKPCPIIDGSGPCTTKMASLCTNCREPHVSYFEGAVLPLAQTEPGYEKCPKLYEVLAGHNTGVTVSLCACGKVREVGHQYCLDCKKKAHNQKMRKYRNKAG